MITGNNTLYSDNSTSAEYPEGGAYMEYFNAAGSGTNA